MIESNRILGALSAADLEVLKPHLRPVKLEHQRNLYDTGDPVPVVCFPLTCLVSLVVPLSTGQSVEAAMLGREGIVGAGAALGGKISLNRAIIQLPGNAFRVQGQGLGDGSISEPRFDRHARSS